jgi:hypothetical protein
MLLGGYFWAVVMVVVCVLGGYTANGLQSVEREMDDEDLSAMMLGGE